MGAASVLACSVWLCGCASQPMTVDAPPPRIDQLAPQLRLSHAPEHALDWAGTYQAVLPCNGCAGIAMRVQLRSDQTAVVHERRMGGSLDHAPAPTYTGPFRFDPPGSSAITLRHSAQAAPVYQFLVGEGWIEIRERSTATAQLPHATYRLLKTSVPSQ